MIFYEISNAPKDGSLILGKQKDGKIQVIWYSVAFQEWITYNDVIFYPIEYSILFLDEFITDEEMLECKKILVKADEQHKLSKVNIIQSSYKEDNVTFLASMGLYSDQTFYYPNFAVDNVVLDIDDKLYIIKTSGQNWYTVNGSRKTFNTFECAKKYVITKLKKQGKIS